MPGQRPVVVHDRRGREVARMPGDGAEMHLGPCPVCDLFGAGTVRGGRFVRAAHPCDGPRGG